MTGHERYAPPRAELADPAEADALLAMRPRSVVWGVALWALSLAISLVSMLPFIDSLMADETLAMTAMIWAITLAVTAIDLWLLRCVWQRRNWARWATLALLALDLVATATTSVEELAPLAAALALAAAVLGVAAALLLLAGPSARWFNGAPPGTH